MVSSPLEELLRDLARQPGVRVAPASGEPTVPAPAVLTPDLAQMFALCGGLGPLGEDGWQVCGPAGFKRASPRLLGRDIDGEVLVDQPEDVTVHCYVFADDGLASSTGPHLVVDLHPARAGRFYDVFWDRYGLAGSMPVVATNVTDALLWLLTGDDERPDPLGDAYEAGTR